MTDDVEIDYPYETKCSAKRFSFKVPGWLKGLFHKYLEQFPLSSEDDCCFLKNWSKKEHGRGVYEIWGRTTLLLRQKRW